MYKCHEREKIWSPLCLHSTKEGKIDSLQRSKIKESILKEVAFQMCLREWDIAESGRRTGVSKFLGWAMVNGLAWLKHSGTRVEVRWWLTRDRFTESSEQHNVMVKDFILQKEEIDLRIFNRDSLCFRS